MESNDPQYSVQRIQIAIAVQPPSSSQLSPPLGIELIEIVGGGSAAQTNLQVGDIISAIVLGEHVRFPTFGYNDTIAAIQIARQGTSTTEVILEINRLVENEIIQ